MKKCVLIIICVLCIVFVTVAAVYFSSKYIGNITPGSSSDSLYNYCQAQNRISLFVFDSNLYYICDSLYTVENGWKKEVDSFKQMLNELEMEATNIIYADGYVYVVLTNKDNDSNSGRSIYALDLRNNEYSHVIDSRVFDVFVGEDLKTVYISLYNDTNGNQQDTLVALKGEIVGKSRKTYYTVEYNGTEYGKTERRSLDLCVFKDDRYTKTDFKTDEYYAIEQGLLFVKDAPDIVSVYNADTKVLSPVFTTDDTYVTAAINRHGEYLYVSFMRQYIADSGFYSTFENDDISGTYRININTFESTKISDYVFDSLFIFDDSGIFAISDSYLYKLAFDGESLEEYGKLD